ncbi:MAG: putative TonB-dependent receptor [Verrucomicrobiales bacterium]|nr:putative TonB-dependent receptor [Verrucomicrobiales bacterium]MDB6129588.1 putative TonB-dependent receptor [Verrucomicrobiales bacterium]
MARKKKNSAKVNLIFSMVFHAALVALLFFWAAREGVLGKKLKEIAVIMVPKEKPPEPPKEKPPEPKIEPPKDDTPKPTPVPQVAQNTPPPQNNAPANNAPPAVAPPAAAAADFNFSDGYKAVESTTNAPVAYYKNLVEYSLRSNWVRPENVRDDSYVTEVEIQMDPTGKLTGYSLTKQSGDKVWDDSIRKAVANTKSLSKAPPKGFPGKFIVRFDVQQATESVFGE